jgi:hypothetical protein
MNEDSAAEPSLAERSTLVISVTLIWICAVIVLLGLRSSVSSTRLAATVYVVSRSTTSHRHEQPHSQCVNTTIGKVFTVLVSMKDTYLPMAASLMPRRKTASLIWDERHQFTLHPTGLAMEIAATPCEVADTHEPREARRTDTAESSLCSKGVCAVTTFGASGSSAACIGNIKGGSKALSLSKCSPVDDFRPNEYVLIANAGPPTILSQPKAPTLTIKGKRGDAAWSYQIDYVSRWGDYPIASIRKTVLSGPSVATSMNFVAIASPSIGYTYCDTVVYRTSAPTGVPTGKIGYIPGGCFGGSLDDTNLPVVIDTLTPAQPPAHAQHQFVIDKIVSQRGVSTFVLETAASSTADHISVIHDDTQAAQACENAAHAIHGVCYWPRGTYNIDQVSWWNSTSRHWVYENPRDTGTPANEMFGLIHLLSHTTVRGQSNAATTLRSPMEIVGGVVTATFATANPTATSIPGAICATGVEGRIVKIRIKDAVLGERRVQTVNQTDAGVFKTGDVVVTGGGAKSGNVACSDLYPRIEPNRVVAVDSTTGVVKFAYPLQTNFPYGTGTPPFLAQVNQFYFTDVAVSDLTLDGSGGLAIESTINGRVRRVALISTAWLYKLNLAGSRDIVLQDSTFVTTSGEEIDQAADVTFDHDVFMQSGGHAQLSFDQGTSGIAYTHNLVVSTNRTSGINKRAGSMSALQITCANGVLIEDNRFSQMSEDKISSIIVSEPNDCRTTPPPRKWEIRRNHFEQTLPNGGPEAINEPTIHISDQVIDGNEMRSYAGSTGWFINVLSGTVSHNSLVAANGFMPQGAIRVANKVVSIIPLIIDSNWINDPYADNGISLYNSAIMPLTIIKNRCILGAGGTCIYDAGSNGTAIVNNNRVRGRGAILYRRSH